jgi:hypothetical protein
MIGILFCLNVSAQKSTDTTRIIFEKAYSEMDAMLNGKQTLSFKRAVFLSENAYLENRLSYSAFDLSIKSAAYYCQKMAENVPLNHPKEKPLGVNYAIFQHITDTTQHVFGKDTFNFLPYKYDFQDFNGQKNWESMFVTKMLREGTGNCRSLPYYYKLLADECGVQACLALAPNHVYIKHWDVGKKKEGWMKRIYNIELTNGSFPMDGWLMASGYITLDAIRNGFYLDTLGARRSVALCLLDLAKGYERKFGKRDAFVSKCVERVLQVHPSNINALLLKSELLKDQYERTKLPADYQNLYQHCSTLVANGYREMPLDMYLNWLFEVRAKANAFENVKYLPKKFDTYKGHPYKDDSVMRKKVPMQTLTDGRYDEFPDFAETTYVGSAVYDVYKKKIVGFIKRDTLYSEATLEPDVVSRWLSTDPVFHPYESPYVAFANNPVYFVDPRGTTVDDYFNSDGTFSHSTKTGTQIRVLSADKKSSKLFSELNVKDKANWKTAANIVGHYSTQIGYKGGKSGISPNSGRGANTLAYTNSQGIWLNTQEGINPKLNDYNNLKSTMFHEKTHWEEPQKIRANYTFDAHVEVYMKQIQDPSFKQTTPEFQLGIINSMSGYLMGAYTKEEISTDKFQQSIKNFNNLKIGFTLEPEIYSGGAIIKVHSTINGKKSTSNPEEKKDPH